MHSALGPVAGLPDRSLGVVGMCCSRLAAVAAASGVRLLAHIARASMQEPCVCPQIQEAILAHRRQSAERRPAFHLAPASGWINDPNGPLLHNGTYHLFYQHVPRSSEWQWGLVWGHAKSTDLVTWEHLPIALTPSADGPDRHGCFSGCAALDLDGRPSLLYTGVVRKQDAQPDVSPQHEVQMIAVAADPADPDLTRWDNLPGNFLPPPPPGMDLTGWRDPFVLERPSAASPWWVLMVGAGVRGKCGTALVYRSRDLTAGWEYVGPLCESPDSFMWECPIMAQLSNERPSATSGSGAHGGSDHGHQQQQQQQQQQQREGALRRHMLSVSPDYCVNGIAYWLGHYAAGKFDLATASGPHLLDLGDVLYAPNVLTDKQGRTVLWAWMQEKQHLRLPGAYTSACCLCVPRVLSLSPDGSALCQQPLPELRQLRQAEAARAAVSGSDGATPLPPGRQLSLVAAPGGSSSLDLELEVARGQADSIVLVLQPFAGVAGAAGAGICYHWPTRTLQVVNSTDLDALQRVSALPLPQRAHHRQPGPDPLQLAAAEAAAAGPGMPARCGGVVAGAQAASSGGDILSLRVLLDGSAVEVFTGCGAALATRVYRGDEAPVPQPPLSAAEAAQEQQHAGDAAQAGRGSSHLTAAAAAADAGAAAAAAGWSELFASAGSSAATCTAGGGGGLAGGQLELVSFGPGPAQLLRAHAWRMRSMWQQQQQQQEWQQQEWQQAALAADAAPALAGDRPASPASAALPAPAAAAVSAAAGAVLHGLLAAEAAAATAAAAAATVAPLVLPAAELPLDAAAVEGGMADAAAVAALSPSAGFTRPLSPTVPVQAA